MKNELNPGDAITGPPGWPAKLAEQGVLRDVLEALPLGVLLVDAGGCSIYQNAASRRLLGAEPWEALRTAAAGASSGEGRARELDRVRRGASLCEYELCLRGNPGAAPRWLLLDAFPLRAGEDDAVCLLTFREVTGPRADRMMCEKLSRVVEQTADVVVITDAQGVIEYVNPAFEAVTGHPRAEVTGMTPGFLRSGQHDAAFYRQLWDTILAKRPYRGTIVNRRKSGELFVSEQTITAVMDESGAITHFVSVAKDVTEARQAESRAREMALARAVQQRLYPRSFPDLPGYDLSGQAFPMGSVGGDYFDFIPSAGGGLCLVIGDVSGHGPDAALYMSAARAYLRLAAEWENDPAAMLATVNRMLSRDLDSNRFVTLLVVCLDPVKRRLCYANAGHVPGVLLDPDGAVKLSLSGTGLPLGVMPEGTYSRVRCELSEGDTVAMFTDGVTEASSPGGEFFEHARALRVVRSHRHEPADSIVQQLHRACLDFVGDGPVSDDFAAVVCKLVSRTPADDPFSPR